MSTGKEETVLQIRPDNAAPLGMSYLPTIPDDSYVFEMEEGVSQTREEVVDFLSNNLLRRPVHNILRRRRELATAEQQRELDDGWVFLRMLTAWYLLWVRNLLVLTNKDLFTNVQLYLSLCIIKTI
ncbi:hypothetical protein ACHAWO_012533 [Cyclotella atomus]|uniref:Uncharacterized protein n=1 Tax=Cyclotella atomus TaxID=382360 RepID=A0ABD3NQS6_9STRA